MPCDSLNLSRLQEQQREQELRELESLMEAGAVTVRRDAFGNVEFVGWETDRTGPGHWHDGCAYRTLLSEGSMALAMAQTETTNWVINER